MLSRETKYLRLFTFQNLRIGGKETIPMTLVQTALVNSTEPKKKQQQQITSANVV